MPAAHFHLRASHTLSNSACPELKLGPSPYLVFASGFPLPLEKKKKSVIITVVFQVLGPKRSDLKLPPSPSSSRLCFWVILLKPSWLPDWSSNKPGRGLSQGVVFIIPSVWNAVAQDHIAPDLSPSPHSGFCWNISCSQKLLWPADHSLSPYPALFLIQSSYHHLTSMCLLSVLPSLEYVSLFSWILST